MEDALRHNGLVEDTERWATVKGYAKNFGMAHTLFTNCLRSLTGIAAGKINGHTVIEDVSFLTLYQSPAIKALLYAAAEALHPDALQAQKLSTKHLVSVFQVEELAYIIGASYLYRQARKRTDATLWQGLSKEIRWQMEVGALVGQAIPAIGIGKGILLGSIRYIAMSMFAHDDIRNFKEFRRGLVRDDRLFDLRDEEKRWGCTHLEIAAVLLQSLCLGRAPAAGILASTQSLTFMQQVEPDAQPWLAAVLWTQSLLEREKAPALYEKGSPYWVAPEVFARLNQEADAVGSNAEAFKWIETRKDEIPGDVIEKLERKGADDSGAHEAPEVLE